MVVTDYNSYYAKTETGQKFLSGRSSRTADGKFNINTGTIKTVVVPIPDIKEQQQIVSTIETIDNKFQHYKKKKQCLESLFNSMLCQLMTGKIRVKDLSFEKEYKIEEDKLSMAAEP